MLKNFRTCFFSSCLLTLIKKFAFIDFLNRIKPAEVANVLLHLRISCACFYFVVVSFCLVLYLHSFYCFAFLLLVFSPLKRNITFASHISFSYLLFRILNDSLVAFSATRLSHCSLH